MDGLSGLCWQKEEDGSPLDTILASIMIALFVDLQQIVFIMVAQTPPRVVRAQLCDAAVCAAAAAGVEHVGSSSALQLASAAAAAAALRSRLPPPQTC